MIYTMYNTIAIGCPVKRVVDASGREWTRTLMVDTVEGIIKRQVTDERDRVLYNWETGWAQAEIVRVPTPITVEFHVTKEEYDDAVRRAGLVQG